MRLPNSLRARISLLVVIPLAVQLGLLARLTYIQHQAEVALKNADKYSKVVLALNDVNSQIFTLAETFYSMKMDLQNADNIIDQVQKTVAGFNASIDNTRAVVTDDPQAVSSLNDCIAMKERLMSLVRQFAASFLNGERRANRKELNKQFVVELRSGAATISRMESNLHMLANDRLHKSMQWRAEEPLLLGAFGVVTALLGVVATFALSHDASQKLANLRRNVANLANGAELQPAAAGDDEIAHIDKTFYDTAISLRRAQANQRELVSMFTHDMRNPLTSMALALDSLAEKPELEPYTTKIGSLRNNTRRLSELISDLLDLYKSETGMMTFAVEPFDANDVCADAVSAVFDAANALRVQVTAKVPDGLRVRGDKKATNRVLINLLSNAIKHSPADSTVEMKAHSDGEFVAFEVTDHGPGIPEHERSTIFDRFQQASTAQHSRIPGLGSGLGLAICKTFAERQNGQVQLAASTVGGGSTFRLRLPKAQA